MDIPRLYVLHCKYLNARFECSGTRCGDTAPLIMNIINIIKFMIDS